LPLTRVKMSHDDRFLPMPRTISLSHHSDV
jgi:hypothetical protein